MTIEYHPKPYHTQKAHGNGRVRGNHDLAYKGNTWGHNSVVHQSSSMDQSFSFDQSSNMDQNSKAVTNSTLVAYRDALLYYREQSKSKMDFSHLNGHLGYSKKDVPDISGKKRQVIAIIKEFKKLLHNLRHEIFIDDTAIVTKKTKEQVQESISSLSEKLTKIKTIQKDSTTRLTHLRWEAGPERRGFYSGGWDSCDFGPSCKECNVAVEATRLESLIEKCNRLIKLIPQLQATGEALKIRLEKFEKQNLRNHQQPDQKPKFQQPEFQQSELKQPEFKARA